MNRKKFLITLLGILVILKRKNLLPIKDNSKIPENSLKTNKKLLG